MQQLQLREAARVQTAEAQGKAFMFGAQEKREMAQLNRLAALQQNAAGQAAQLQGQASAMTGQALGSVGSLLGAMGATASYNQYLGDNTGTNINMPGFLRFRENRIQNQVSNFRNSAAGQLFRTNQALQNSYTTPALGYSNITSIGLA